MSVTRIAVYGAGGLGKEFRAMVEDQFSNTKQLEFAGFIDDHVKPQPAADVMTVDDIVIAIALPEARRKVSAKLKNDGYPFTPLIHPSVQVRSSVTIGPGSVICAGVQMTVDIKTGSFVIINLNATIGHDVQLGNFVSIMPGVNISGNVKVGDNVFIGSAAVVLQGLTIGSGAVIGAGAVVTKDVPPNVTVAGVPARLLKK